MQKIKNNGYFKVIISSVGIIFFLLIYYLSKSNLISANKYMENLDSNISNLNTQKLLSDSESSAPAKFSLAFTGAQCCAPTSTTGGEVSSGNCFNVPPTLPRCPGNFILVKQ